MAELDHIFDEFNDCANFFRFPKINMYELITKTPPSEKVQKVDPTRASFNHGLRERNTLRH